MAIMFYRGVMYKSRKEACVEYGVPYWLFTKLIKQGYSPCGALDKGLLCKSQNYIVNGEVFDSKKDICKKYGFNYKDFCDKVNSSSSDTDMDSIVKDFSKNRSESYIKVFDREFSSKSDIARFYNISLSMLHYRLSRGMDIESAINDLLDKPRYKVGECIFVKLSSLCSYYSVCDMLVLDYLNSGYSLEDSVRLAADMGSRKKYLSKLDKIYDMNITEKELNSLLLRGISLNEIIDGSGFDSHYGVNGRKFKSLEDVETCYGLEKGTLKNIHFSKRSLLEIINSHLKGLF